MKELKAIGRKPTEEEKKEALYRAIRAKHEMFFTGILNNLVGARQCATEEDMAQCVKLAKFGADEAIKQYYGPASDKD